jgi:3-carboxy-cis,cis-muconate cycloisomerase
MMGLGKKIGRQYAHDLVYDICRKAAAEGPGGKKLIEFLWENEEIRRAMGREELEELCEPANYLGLSVEMTDRVLTGEGSMSVSRDGLDR